MLTLARRHRAVPGATLLVALLALLALVASSLVASSSVASPPVGAAAARADIVRSDFPSKAYVKSVMRGKGQWYSGLGDPNAGPLDAIPAQCRSNLTLASATEFRSRSYTGPVKRSSKYLGQVQATIYRFATRATARQAVNYLAAQVAACPQYREWVCQDCDGVWDVTQRPIAGHRVGTQSTAWNSRRAGLGISNGHVIAARTGKVVVVVEVAHQGDPVELRTPPRPSWAKTERITRHALRVARS